MTTSTGRPARIVLAATFLTLVIAAPLHAAKPYEDVEDLVASKREARAARARLNARILGDARAKLDLVPGRAFRFPRELLPLMASEMEADIEEPGLTAEPVDDAADRGTRPVFGTNRLINDPTGDPLGATQSENSIAAHGRYLVAGWNESFDPLRPRSFSGYGYSSDGGKTWTDGGTLPRASTTDFAFGDPVVAVDDDGNFYYASLYTPDGVSLGVSVSRGRFRGRSFAFGAPVLAGRPDPASDLDKEWIAVDPKNGDVYVSYTRFFLSGTQRIELVRSRDKGKTWSPPVALTDTTAEAPQGSRVIVGPDHEVYVVWASVDLTAFTAHMKIRKSTDRGRTFRRAVRIGERASETGGLFLNFVTGPPGFNRPGGVELPSIAIDRRGNDRGDLYVTWPEGVNFFEDPLGEAGVVVETESNDSALVATAITPGVTVVGSYGTPLDVDLYAFQGAAGQTVEFFLTPAPGSTADGFLRLLGPGGRNADRLAFSSFGGGQAFIVFTLPRTGTYYVRTSLRNPFVPTGPYLMFTGLHQPRPDEVGRDHRDIVISRSSDGMTWTRRRIVNHDPPGFDNALPEVAVDDRGDVHVVWYDHRNDPAGILTDVYATRSTDGGRRWERDQRVNDGPGVNWNLVPSQLAPNMGDYIALVADGKNVYANWADGRLGSPDSWMAMLRNESRHEDDDGASRIALELGARPTGTFALQVANPVRPGKPIAVSFELPRADAVQIEVFSVAGQRLRTLVHGTFPAGRQRLTWDARGREGTALAPGVYFVTMTSGATKLMRRVVLLQ